MVSYQKTDILTNTVNTKVHGFPTVLAKEKKEAHSTFSVKKNYWYIQIHILSFQLYYTTKSIKKQQLLYVLFDASKLHIIYNM